MPNEDDCMQRHAMWRLPALLLIALLYLTGSAQAQDQRVEASITFVAVERYGLRLGESADDRVPYSRMWWVRQCCKQQRHTKRPGQACTRPEVAMPMAQQICLALYPAPTRDQ